MDSRGGRTIINRFLQICWIRIRFFVLCTVFDNSHIIPEILCSSEGTALLFCIVALTPLVLNLLRFRAEFPVLLLSCGTSNGGASGAATSGNRACQQCLKIIHKSSNNLDQATVDMNQVSYKYY